MRKFTRELYKKIKKFDRNEMEQFCNTLYQEGFNEGMKCSKEAEKTGFKELLQALKAGRCRGIGSSTISKLESFIQEVFQGGK